MSIGSDTPAVVASGPEAVGHTAVERAAEAEAKAAGTEADGQVRLVIQNSPDAKSLPLGPTPIALWDWLSPDWTALSRQIDEAATAVAETAGQETQSRSPLLEDAQAAYHAGNFPLALELLYGYLARGGQQGLRDIDRVGFSAKLRRPTWHIHWAVAFSVRGDTDVAEPSPITADGGIGDERDSPPVERESREAELREREFRENGPAGTDADGATRDRPTEAVDPSVHQSMQRVLGLVAEQMSQTMKAQISGGDLGPAIQLLTSDSDPSRRARSFSAAGPDAKLWLPGIVFIGEGHAIPMTEKAGKQDFDYLLHADVLIREKTIRSRPGIGGQSRGGRFGPGNEESESSVQNVSQLRVIDCREGKNIIISAEMDTVELDRLVENERSTPEEYVGEKTDTMRKFIRAKLGLSPMPELTEEAARGRIQMVLRSPSLSPLRKLTEIRWFAQRGLLPEQELDQLFQVVAGFEGLKILHGSQRQAREAITKLARDATSGQ